MRVEVYKCRATGKIFEKSNVAKYKKHLATIRAASKEARRLATVKETFAGWLANEKLNIKYVDEIAPWFLKNQQFIMDASTALADQTAFSDGTFRPGDVYTSFEITSAGYSPNISNSHCCPTNGGVTNWCGRVPDLPTGYVGWTCSLTGTLSRTTERSGYPTSSLLDLIGVKTTGGGGGNTSWRWSAGIFLLDWPGLQHEINNIERDRLVKVLMHGR